jgi:dTDP-4-amino-4,6-dideoxygalactose transaminase
MDNRNISFSPPDITQEEINAVIEVLKSGWITSGPKVAEFEKKLQKYCSVNKAVALNSATAAMELVLKVIGINKDDEVISTPYTYTATSSVVIHKGIKPKLIDLEKDSFFMDLNKLETAITPKTKIIMPLLNMSYYFQTMLYKLVLHNLELISYMS